MIVHKIKSLHKAERMRREMEHAPLPAKVIYVSKDITITCWNKKARDAIAAAGLTIHDKAEEIYAIS